MTCPNCFCAACQAERQRWMVPFPGNGLPNIPAWPVPVTPASPGHWWCGTCMKAHPLGYTCVTAGKFP